MKLILLGLIVLIVYTLGVPILSDVETEWSKFKEQHGKQYNSSNEENNRKKIFSTNYEMIVNHNKRYEEGVETYFMKISERADMTMDERKKFNCFKSSNVSLNHAVFDPEEGITVPSSIDWREKGAVTPVKNQGDCGSCWAFSATGSLEGQYFLKTGKLVALSEQNLVDCSHNNFNRGCKGGDIVPAFIYIHNNDGIDSQTSYPYLAREGGCRYSDVGRVTSLEDFKVIKKDSERALKIAVAKKGPISTSIDYTGMEFYAGGIYYNSACKSNLHDLNHSVLVVGFGKENGQAYWLVKNSRGSNWGLNGYVKMARKRNNNCGIATEACYPVI